jgi:GTPase
MKGQLARLKRAAKTRPYVLSSVSGRGVPEVLRAVLGFIDTEKQESEPAVAQGEWTP